MHRSRDLLTGLVLRRTGGGFGSGWLIRASLCLALCAGAVQARAQNLVQDGNFANPNVGTGWSLFANGAVSAWLSNNNEIEIDNQLVVMPTYYLGVAGNSMEADGTTFDTITQTINNLVAGQNYVLSWGYGDRPGSGPQELVVSLGGQTVAVNAGTGSGVWTSNTFTITATAATETLSFAAQNMGGAASVGNEVANVALTKVPEPAAWPLLCAGLLGLGLIRRKADLFTRSRSRISRVPAG